MRSAPRKLPTTQQPSAAAVCAPLQANLRDSAVKKQVERSLAASGHPLLRTVEVVVHEGLVTLKGALPSYYLKQMAQVAAMQGQPIELLQNDIEVADPNSR